MKPRLLDRIGLLAIILYILGALSYYLPFFFRTGSQTALTLQLYLVLPPVGAGAAVYEVFRRHRGSQFAPRVLAAAGLGSGAAIRLAWELFLVALLQYNLRRPAPGIPRGDLGPGFGLLLPYMLLCGVLSVVAALALPKLCWMLVRDFRTDAPE